MLLELSALTLFCRCAYNGTCEKNLKGEDKNESECNSSS